MDINVTINGLEKSLTCQPGETLMTVLRREGSGDGRGLGEADQGLVVQEPGQGGHAEASGRGRTGPFAGAPESDSVT